MQSGIYYLYRRCGRYLVEYRGTLRYRLSGCPLWSPLQCSVSRDTPAARRDQRGRYDTYSARYLQHSYPEDRMRSIWWTTCALSALFLSIACCTRIAMADDTIELKLEPLHLESAGGFNSIRMVMVNGHIMIAMLVDTGDGVPSVHVVPIDSTS